MSMEQKRQDVKRQILQYLKDNGVRGLVDDIRDADLNHPYADLTDKNHGQCWLAIYLGSTNANGKGTFLQLYSKDPECAIDLKFSRYCIVHSRDTKRIEFMQEDPIAEHAETRDMGRIPHLTMSWESIGPNELQVLLGDCKLLLKSANEILGLFPGCV